MAVSYSTIIVYLKKALNFFRVHRTVSVIYSKLHTCKIKPIVLDNDEGICIGQ